MIPKIIHYCWFGNGEMDDISQKCIKSWEKFCPEYEIKLWNEETFDVNSNIFVSEAFKAKKWAFVSDYIRLYVLYNYGGVYLDADVEIIKPIDEFLTFDGVVTGYQDYIIPAAIMFSEPGNKWIKRLLDYYKDRHFVKSNGEYDMIENDKIITQICIQEFGFRIGDEYIDYGNVRLFENSYFGPMNHRSPFPGAKKKFDIDKKKTYTIHHGVGSWSDSKNSISMRLWLHFMSVIRCFVPSKIYSWIKVVAYKKQMGL